MRLEDFPRVPLLFGPSPVHPLERLSRHLGGQVELWAKREDCNSGLAFGGNKKLQFGASLNHTSSVSRDSVTVSMQEAIAPGVVQREIFPLARIERTQLGLQAALSVARNVQFTATYGAQLQDTKNTSSLMLKANIRY